jgi:hypothetical protein
MWNSWGMLTVDKSAAKLMSWAWELSPLSDGQSSTGHLGKASALTDLGRKGQEERAPLA